MRSVAVVGLLLLGWLGLAGGANGASLVRVTPESYEGSGPSFLTAPPHDGRVFIGMRGDWRGGPTILIAEEGTLRPQPFLELGNVSLEGERGFLSFAFDPDYAASGLLYVFYTAAGPDSLDPSGATGDVRVVEYRRSTSDPDHADPASARLVLKVPHGTDIHNGGWIGFGPDGLLYVTVGDDGYPGNSQDLGSPLGKVLRIDPADPPGAAAYSIPADNPFAATAGARGEVWAYGLRNPFRASFTPDGRLTVADVGQSDWEEINLAPRGANLGWPQCEGASCWETPPGHRPPVHAYPWDGDGQACAVIGGYVVRDPGLGSLTGRYLFGDFCGTSLRTIDLDAPGADPRPAGIHLPGGRYSLRSFGEDSRGCVYVLTDSDVYRVAGDVATGGCPVAPPRASYDVTLRKRQPLRRGIPVRVRCSIGCTVSATAKVRASGRPKLAVKAKPARSRASAGTAATLTLRLPARRMKALRKALRKRRALTATVRVTAIGDDGSRVDRTRRARLLRRKG